jgi:hypothetical protein
MFYYDICKSTENQIASLFTSPSSNSTTSSSMFYFHSRLQNFFKHNAPTNTENCPLQLLNLTTLSDIWFRVVTL